MGQTPSQNDNGEPAKILTFGKMNVTEGQDRPKLTWLVSTEEI
jgi:hypothetical protein